MAAPTVLFVQTGNSIDYTPGAAVAAGDVVAIGTAYWGVASLDIAAGALGALQVTGIFKMPQTAGVIAFGAVLYWDPALKIVTTVAGALVRFGICSTAALAGDTTVLVLKDGSPA